MLDICSLVRTFVCLLRALGKEMAATQATAQKIKGGILRVIIKVCKRVEETFI